MQQNKVVIKINYDKPQWNQSLSSAPAVTVWHVRRIVCAVLALVVVLAWALGVWQTEVTESVSQGHDSANRDAVVSIAPINTSNNSLEITAAKSTPTLSQQPLFTVTDKRVIRTFLNQGVFTQHPYKSVKSSVVVSPSKSVSVFYLTLLHPHADGVYYHRWRHPLRGDIRQAVVHKQLHTKLFSAKIFTAEDLGEWTVQLLDSNDAVLSEVKFSVTLK